MDREQLTAELQCPITLELLEDPITLPCCGRACSRAALVTSAEVAQICPLCRSSFEDLGFDPTEAVRNRSLQDILSLLAQPEQPEGNLLEILPEDPDAAPTVTAAYAPLAVPTTTAKDVDRVARLQIRITNAPRLGLRRVLAVLLVDQSGSMSGSPWRQVSTALKHIVAMSRSAHLSHVALSVATYQSNASLLSTEGPLQSVMDRIDAVRAGGGTSFRAAFDAACVAIRQAAQSDACPENVHIVFMTDGQASESRDGLADEFSSVLSRLRASLAQQSPQGSAPDITVHAVGFSSGCDKVLLEQIREAGNHRGQYRYAEPGDTEEALCARLTGFFEMIGAHGGCDVTVANAVSSGVMGGNGEGAGNAHQNQQCWRFLGASGQELTDGNEVTLQLRTKPDGTGTATAWVAMRTDTPASAVLPVAITVRGGGNPSGAGGEGGVEERGPPDYSLLAVEDTSFAAVDAVRRAWVGVRIHRVADEAIDLVRRGTTPAGEGASTAPLPAAAVRLAASLLANRIRAVDSVASDAHDRVPALLEQLAVLREWEGPQSASGVNVGRLQDISSASAFSSGKVRVEAPRPEPTTGAPSTVGRTAAPTQRTGRGRRTAGGSVLTVDAPVEEVSAKIDLKGEGRSLLQQSIVEWGMKKNCGGNARSALEGSCPDPSGWKAAVCERDLDGNTAVHLAAAFGQADTLKAFTDAVGPLPKRKVLSARNAQGETPLTLAIKRRGFDRTVRVLIEMGARIDEEARVERLIRFALREGYTRTASMLEELSVSGSLLLPEADDEGEEGDEGVSGGVGSTKEGGSQSQSQLPPLEVDESMSLAMVLARVEHASAAGRPVGWGSVMRSALRHCSVDLLRRAAKEMGEEGAAEEAMDPEWVFTDCFPKKPDAPDTQEWLDLLRAALEVAPKAASARLVSTEDTLLHRAVEKGSLPHCEFIVDKAGVWVDERNRLGNTALYVACAKKYPCIVDYLIDSGADVNAANLKVMVPIGVSIQMGTLRLVERLLAAGAMIDGPGTVTTRGDTLVHLAVRNNQPGILALLLDQCDPDQLLQTASVDGFNPLQAAVEGDRTECLSLLLDAAEQHAKRGVPGFGGEGYINSVTAADGPVLPGSTAVHLAVHYGRHRTLALLLRRGADGNSQAGAAKDKITPLHRAAHCKDATAVHLLVSHGVDTTLRDASGRTAGSYASGDPAVTDALCGPTVVPLRAFAVGYSDAATNAACAAVVKEARETAAEPGMLSVLRVLDGPLDDDGSTAVQIAAAHGNATAVEVLVGLGADVKREDAGGVNAVAWAQMRNSHSLKDAVGDVPGSPLPSAARVAEVRKRRGGADAMAVFLAPRPATRNVELPTLQSSITDRLVLLGEQGSTVGGDADTALALLRSCSVQTAAPDRVRLGPSAEVIPKEQLELDMWVSKIATARAVASGVTEPRTAYLLTLHAATRNGSLLRSLNDELASAPPSGLIADVPGNRRSLVDFGAVLRDALESLPTAAQMGGELYMAAPRTLPRSEVAPGCVLRLHGFASAVPAWQSAVAAVDALARTAAPPKSVLPEFGGGKGVVFVITKSVSGRQVGKHAYGDEGEVMFLPGTAFVVRNWYRGDVVALGQANIRDRSYRIDDEDELAAVAAGRGGLIVSLEEV